MDDLLIAVTSRPRRGHTRAPGVWTLTTGADLDVVQLAERAAADRWSRLERLIETLTRCTEVTARLDAYPATPLSAKQRWRYARIDRRIDQLTARINTEVDRLTAEKLRVDLARRQAHDAAQARVGAVRATLVTDWVEDAEAVSA